MSVSKSKEKHELVDPDAVKAPIFSVRFLISLLLIAAGIAYVVIWTLYVRDARAFDLGDGSEPKELINGMAKLKDWNWAIGFGLLFIGLGVSAHPKTPLGRGRGVIVGMLGCFLIGLIWICTFYVFADKPEGEIWLLGDLGQLNLVVGIGFMAVGFTFATRWE
ncbi:hypothetical protein ASG90_18265 [Nocardioides sp. Soil797]|nr:hypothetical protein ASG90_18265 [Nocardioides sp. Soil797]